MSNPPRIKSITVKGLFNQFDHHIELNQEERITILHGINGVGKTTLLYMISTLLWSNIDYFNNLLFSSFSLILSNDSKIELKRKTNTEMELIVNQESFNIDFQKKRALFSLNSIEDRLSKEKWEHISKIGLPKALFIGTSRLWGGSHSSVIARVTEYAKELKGKISTVMADYGVISEQLDQTFPFRLLDTSEVAVEHIKVDMETLQKKRQQLREIGLLPESIIPLDNSSMDNLEKHHTPVMSLYIKDSKEKLAVLESFGKKIKLLLDIINSKFQGKALKIDEKKGLIIIGKDGEIDLSLLSSGEQHEIVMFYDLIFKVEPNTLVMIDEPELSLHVTWQNKFINELKQIVQHSEFDVLIATHSSTIIGKNSHLMVRLGVNE